MTPRSKKVICGIVAMIGGAVILDHSNSITSGVVLIAIGFMVAFMSYLE